MEPIDIAIDVPVRYIEVPGEPVAKGRPRFTSGGVAFTPKKTSDAETLVENQFRMFYPDVEPFPLDTELLMCIVFWKSKHGKPDLDNLEKLVKDALNGLAYADDQQVKHTDCSMLEPDRMAWGKRARRLVKWRTGMPITYGGKPYEPNTQIHIEPATGTIHTINKRRYEVMEEITKDAGTQAEYR